MARSPKTRSVEASGAVNGACAWQSAITDAPTLLAFVIGYLPMTREQANLFFQVIAALYGKAA